MKWMKFPTSPEQIDKIGLFVPFIATDITTMRYVPGLFDCGEVYWPQDLPEGFVPRFWIPSPGDPEVTDPEQAEIREALYGPELIELHGYKGK